ncbi:MAG TPA: hypothetical protein PK513_09580 [Alphaproteobacteria bacterium]|nr:MAG: hypothetical protein H6859_07245 [Rhodospirillales bacterium]HOO82742.1 hypothetical protein [Alphaproteobacteria bacterium]
MSFVKAARKTAEQLALRDIQNDAARGEGLGITDSLVAAATRDARQGEGPVECCLLGEVQQDYESHFGL